MQSLGEMIAGRYSADMQKLARYERGDVGLTEDLSFRLSHLAQGVLREVNIASGILAKVCGSVLMLTSSLPNFMKWGTKISIGVSVLSAIGGLFTGELAKQIVPKEAREHILGAYSPQEVLKIGARRDIDTVNSQIYAIAKVVLAGLLAVSVAASLIVLANVSVIWATAAALLVSIGLAVKGIRQVNEEGLPGTLTASPSKVFELTAFTVASIISSGIMLKMISGRIPAVAA